MSKEKEPLTFEKAAEAVRNLKTRPNDDTLLNLYGLFKQASTGDVQSTQPWAFQVEQRRKWDAWNSHKGKTQDVAKREYVEIATKVIASTT